MKRIMMLLVGSLLAFGAADRPAAASTFDLGTISPGTTGDFVANIGPNIVAFDDTINFELVGLQNELVGVIADITDILGLSTDSLNFSLDLFSASDPATSLGNFFDNTGVGLAFSYLNLAAGDYFFRIQGDIDPGFDGNAYSYRFTLTETPIPPALLLFATALGGMAVFGYRRRNLQA